MEHSSPFLFLLFLFLFLFISSSESVTFNCSGTTTCQSLAGYVAPNSTTYGAILSLFQVPTLSQLLGANNLPLSTPASFPIPASSVVRVPLPCSCADGKGRSNHTPVYTVKPTDAGLDDIARLTYDLLITYEEIAEVNGIAAPYKIHAGEKLWIPLPCSCDAVDGEEVVHLAHLVEPGSTIDLIAEQFAASPETLLRINGIVDPRKLEAGQAIDVPLKACSSAISSTSLDSNLRLSNDSYALTANDCIQCSCSSASGYQLACHSTRGLNKFCSSVKCNNQLSLGGTSNSGCEQTTCAYAGYTNATASHSTNILTKTVSRSLCSAPAPAPSPSGGAGSTPSGGSTPGGGSPPASNHSSFRTISHGNWMWLLMTFIVAFIGSSHSA
ncbi:chitin elicitor-binding protein-like isoform X2 [Dendrobium catenatum]|uniref:chitin elicitor-binding protein-like isoform X2 n=1 Tax=Dendrobium catenatum TaxID=906689 RepID=UPI0010A03911|nr:chitin elicitor-binding protein-like isoform X2 [Dendrobium catenatum]